MRYIIILFLSISIGHSQNMGDSQEIIGFQQDESKKVDNHSFYPSDYTYYPNLAVRPMRGKVSDAIWIVGSPFFENYFQPGQVRINEQLAFDVLLRYNANREVIEYAVDGKRYDLSRRKFITAEFGGKTFRILPYFEGDVVKQSYFFLVSEKGEAELYYRPKKDIDKEVTRPYISGQGADFSDPAVCRDVSSYYLKIGQDPAREVDLNEEEILAILGNMGADLLPVIQARGLNLKKEKDVVQVLDYFNREVAKPRKGKTPDQIAAISH